MEGNENQRLLNGNSQSENTTTSQSSWEFNVNSYAARKTMAGGTLNVALLSSNANQLNTLIKSTSEYNGHTYFTMSLLVFSLLLQIVLGILAMIVGGSKVCLVSEDNADNDREKRKLHIMNNWIAGLSMLATVVNVLATSFSS